MTTEDYLRAAFAALLKGDPAERDRLCALAEQELVREQARHAFDVLNVILLPDSSSETRH